MRSRQLARLSLLSGVLAALGVIAACGPAATTPPPLAPLGTATPRVTPPPVPPASTTFYDCQFLPSPESDGQEYRQQKIPIDLKEGDIVAVSIDVISSGQRVSVGVKDPTGADLLSFQYAADTTVTFKAETTGIHTIIVAQDDQRGGANLAAMVRYYPAGSW